MRKIILIVLLIFVSLSPTAGAGEVGNGGDIVPENQVPLEQLLEFLPQARKLSYAYLLRQTYLDSAKLKDDVGLKFILSAKPSIFELIETVKISIQNTKPCIDESGNHSDASSVDLDNSNAICLSVLRLQDRLQENSYVPQDFKFQIIALVIHEYSHRMGFDETSAVQLQKNILEDLRQGRTDYPSEPIQPHEEFGTIKMYAKETMDLILAFESKNPNYSDDEADLGKISQKTSLILAKSVARSETAGFASLSEKEHALFVAYNTLANALSDSFGYFGQHRYPPYGLKRYKKAFENSDTISVGDYLAVFSEGYWFKLVKKYPETQSALSVSFNKINKRKYRSEYIALLRQMIPALEGLSKNAQNRMNLKD